MQRYRYFSAPKWNRRSIMLNLSSRIYWLCDIGFITGLVFALFLGDKVVPLLILTGALPLIFQIRAFKGFSLSIPLGRLLWPAGLYFGYSLLTFFFFTGLRPDEPRPANPDLELYLVAIAMLALGTSRGLSVSSLSRQFQSIVPWALLVSFLVLSGYMFLGIRDGCRVKAEAGWPFIPALIFATLTFLTLLEWAHLTANARRLRYALLTCSIIVTIAYTNSRGIGIAQAVCLGGLAVLSLTGCFRDHLPNWRGLVATAILGLTLSVLVGGITGCGADTRLQSIFRVLTILTGSEAHASNYPKSASPIDPPLQERAITVAQVSAPPGPPPAKATEQKIMDTDPSIGLRLQMWKVSVESFLQAPVFGHGSLYLQRLISTPFGAAYQHNHNQYLTWLATGGIFAFGLGLCFLAIPWFVSLDLPAQDRLVITLSISVFWGVSMIFDSFFGLKFYIHYYCMLVGVIYALATDQIRKDKRQTDAG